MMLKNDVLIFPINMPYELLKITPYSSNGNIGWEDTENVSEFYSNAAFFAAAVCAC